ncbi:hypothetical protein [Leeuwenhoekiella sp. UBA1003]|uniref:hypothetical protein n=1 Tax=Leeuwenhoekiella sp. UBA1003 TaxID=1946744 RepID=UPI0025BAFF87|nr:hypothetical protein [Leeuwenhoekiella sp. UBA1003]|tara:strand:+ start:410 stop:886 length:477 start_codon:yes stop_codon:yes gene_type:complete
MKHLIFMVTALLLSVVSGHAQKGRKIIVTDAMHGTIVTPSQDQVTFNFEKLTNGNYIKVRNTDRNGKVFYSVFRKNGSNIEFGIDKNKLDGVHLGTPIHYTYGDHEPVSTTLGAVVQQRCLGWICFAALYCCIEAHYDSTDGNFTVTWDCDCDTGNKQ